MGDEKDIIHQDFKIMQQILKQCIHEGKEGINIVNVGQIRVETADKNEQELMMTLLRKLPDPKMDSLVKLAYSVAASYLLRDSEVARWLGVNKRTVMNRRIEEQRKAIAASEET